MFVILGGRGLLSWLNSKNLSGLFKEFQYLVYETGRGDIYEFKLFIFFTRSFFPTCKQPYYQQLFYSLFLEN